MRHRWNEPKRDTNGGLQDGRGSTDPVRDQRADCNDRQDYQTDRKRVHHGPSFDSKTSTAVSALRTMRYFDHFSPRALMKMPPTTERAWKPLCLPSVVIYQSVSGTRDVVSFAHLYAGPIRAAKSAPLSASVAVQTIQSSFV